MVNDSKVIFFMGKLFLDGLVAEGWKVSLPVWSLLCHWPVRPQQQGTTGGGGTAGRDIGWFSSLWCLCLGGCHVCGRACHDEASRRAGRCPTVKWTNGCLFLFDHADPHWWTQLKDLKTYVNDGAPDVFIFTFSSLRVSHSTVVY